MRRVRIVSQSPSPSLECLSFPFITKYCRQSEHKTNVSSFLPTPILTAPNSFFPFTTMALHRADTS